MQKRVPHIEELPSNAASDADQARPVRGGMSASARDAADSPLKSQDFMPEKNPELALDYLFEMLCATRRISRINQFQFLAYLIEMAILEVDNERRAVSR